MKKRGAKTMRTWAIVALFLCQFFNATNAQNLVPNPGFESYKKLPCAYPNEFIEDLLENWLQPITTTTDYWNNLVDTVCYFSPINFNVIPRTGIGTIGIVTASIQQEVKTEYKEYVEVKLIAPIRKGSFYNVQFYAKSKDAAFAMPSNVLQSNNLGAAFSDTLIYFGVSVITPNHLHLNPAINSSEIVNENWTKIGKCIIADGDYSYLLIGNFNSIHSTELIQLTFGNIVSNAYYFIDDVKVEELPYEIVHLKQYIDFCFTDPLVELNAFVEGATGYYWEDGTESPVLGVTAREDRDYPVRIAFSECEYEHVFRVRYIPELELGPDTLLCKDEVLVLDPGYPIKEYSWSDGTSDSLKFISAPGQYKLSILSTSCQIEDSIDVSFIDCPGFTPNIITPNGDGFNQNLVFENIFNRVWSLKVLNRFGQLVYFSPSYTNDWEGGDLTSGVYYYILYSPELDKSVKGWVHIVK